MTAMTGVPAWVLAWCVLQVAAAGAPTAGRAGADLEERRTYMGLTFTRGDVEMKGLVRHRHTRTASVTELFLDTSEGRLALVESRAWLTPEYRSRVRVTFSHPTWWIEVERRYPNLQVGSFSEVLDALRPRRAAIVALRASTGELGSGAFELEADYGRGLIEALEQLADGTEMQHAVPADAAALLVRLDEVVGWRPGEVSSAFKLGWPVTELASLTLRSGTDAGVEADGWKVAEGPIVVDLEEAGTAAVELLGRAEAAGLGSS